MFLWHMQVGQYKRLVLKTCGTWFGVALSNAVDAKGRWLLERLSGGFNWFRD